MPEEYQNIYKTCRKAAGFTQEAAAERLGRRLQISLDVLLTPSMAGRYPSVEMMPQVEKGGERGELLFGGQLSVGNSGWNPNP